MARPARFPKITARRVGMGLLMGYATLLCLVIAVGSAGAFVAAWNDPTHPWEAAALPFVTGAGVYGTVRLAGDVQRWWRTHMGGNPPG